MNYDSLYLSLTAKDPSQMAVARYLKLASISGNQGYPSGCFWAFFQGPPLSAADLSRCHHSPEAMSPIDPSTTVHSAQEQSFRSGEADTEKQSYVRAPTVLSAQDQSFRSCEADTDKPFYVRQSDTSCRCVIRSGQSGNFNSRSTAWKRGSFRNGSKSSDTLRYCKKGS